MQWTQNRRRFLTTLSATGVSGLMGTGTSLAQDGPPETTTIRLREGGIVKSSPQKIIAQGTDWRFLNQLERELKA
jgi:hypothetical protein